MWIMETASNKTVRRYVVSSLVTFFAGFAIVFVKEIDSLTLSSLKDGSLAGLLFFSVRSGLKALFELLLLWIGNSKEVVE
jgi:hypothetical protein